MEDSIRIGCAEIYEDGIPYPQEVSINLNDNELPIGLAEGSGHGSAGGSFRLSDMIGDHFHSHLSMCNCLNLKKIAEEEKASGRKFSAAEIYEKWKELRK